MADSWRTVAQVLAERLYHQAYQCPVWNAGLDVDGVSSRNIHEQLEHGSLAASRKAHDRSNCPHCQDTLAYERYERKNRA